MYFKTSYFIAFNLSWVTRTPLKTGGALRCSARVSSSCSTSGTRRVNLVTNPVTRPVRVHSALIRYILQYYESSLPYSHYKQPSHNIINAQKLISSFYEVVIVIYMNTLKCFHSAQNTGRRQINNHNTENWKTWATRAMYSQGVIRSCFV
jgi:hypothetical protein